ncbi:hypothetical protein PUN28_011960 [Cardiocondyla obscurior]|uniref:Uncharacterized protein n=1 Tax=Cardiocondyla obscurior TaxID=286306 RepID=A0AAW2F9U4_9HYME
MGNQSRPPTITTITTTTTTTATATITATFYYYALEAKKKKETKTGRCKTAADTTKRLTEGSIVRINRPTDDRRWIFLYLIARRIITSYDQTSSYTHARAPARKSGKVKSADFHLESTESTRNNEIQLYEIRVKFEDQERKVARCTDRCPDNVIARKKIARKLCYNDPAIGFSYLSRKTLATATRYLYFGENLPNLRFLLRTLIAHLEEKKNGTQHTQYLNQQQIIYTFRKTLNSTIYAHALINLNSMHNDCNVRKAFIVLRVYYLPECLNVFLFFFLFIHSTGLFALFALRIWLKAHNFVNKEVQNAALRYECSTECTIVDSKSV